MGEAAAAAATADFVSFKSYTTNEAPDLTIQKDRQLYI